MLGNALFRLIWGLPSRKYLSRHKTKQKKYSCRLRRMFLMASSVMNGSLVSFLLFSVLKLFIKKSLTSLGIVKNELKLNYIMLRKNNSKQKFEKSKFMFDSLTVD